MRVFVIGTRGFPNMQGGVETHCEELYPRLLQHEKIEVVVFRRKPFVKDGIKSFKGVRFIDVPTIKKRQMEAFLHTFLCLFFILLKRPLIVHFHNIGPGFFIPLVRLIGIKTLLTYHSPNYLHKKWGRFERVFLKLCEVISIRFANHVIFVSETQKFRLDTQFSFLKKKSSVVRNGISILPRSTVDNYIKSLGLVSNAYVLGVGRFIEEKGFHDLIEAFKKIETTCKLVLVGDSDHRTTYSDELKRNAIQNGVILTGFIKGDDLVEVYSHCKLFVLSSYSEGNPIALLEAMSFNCDILVSDIEQNIEMKLAKDDYFKVGDCEDLENKIREKISVSVTRDFKKTLETNHSWSKVASAHFNILSMLNT
ncbi:MAG: glycosyltransferase family 4 protein [Ekhidna sp.]|nr:glycosyltransferase family 4 protein [Ekhidna sp.]